MNYFDGCANLSEAKARRNELVREFHPDNLTRITQEVNAAYEQVKRDVRADGTLPASYQVKPAPQAKPKIIEKVVYRDRIVDRAASVAPRDPNLLYCQTCDMPMEKGGWEWVYVYFQGVFCRTHAPQKVR